MVSKDDQRDIDLARKYGIRLGTLKHYIFSFFEDGYSPSEVTYICRNSYVTKEERKQFDNTVRKYYADWKELNVHKRGKSENK